MLRTRHSMQLPAERKEAVLLETAVLAATQASAATSVPPKRIHGCECHSCPSAHRTGRIPGDEPSHKPYQLTAIPTSTSALASIRTACTIKTAV